MNDSTALLRPTALIAALFLSPLVHGATWDAGSGDYSLPANWNPASVPCFEILPVASDVVIDIAGVTVNQDVLVCSVQSLTLGAGATLSLAAGTTYGANTADIAGIVAGAGGDFTSAGTTFSGTSFRLSAALGSILDLDATSMPATGVPAVGTALLSATGTGSRLQLASLVDLDASFNSTSGAVQSHDIAASDGGVVDLSALTSINVPTDWEDRLSVIVSDTGAVALDSLATTTGTGQMVFSVADGGTLDLPSLSSLQGGRFFAATGGQLTANLSAWTLDTASLLNNSYVIASATNPGSHLDLSGLTGLNAGFDSSNGSVQSHDVVASDGASVDLSGLVAVWVPVDREDRVRFDVSDTGALNLDSLATSTGTGQVYFNVTSGGTLSLPALSALSGGRFFASAGGQISAAGSSWTLDSSALLNNHYVLASATGSGSLLDLSGMTALNAAFNSTNGAVQAHDVAVDDGATVDLSGLTAVTVPVDREDRLGFLVSGTGALDLSRLGASSGGGQVLFQVDAGGSLDLPALGTMTGARFFASSGGQVTANATAWTLDSGALLNANYSLIAATDPGSLLDLSGMMVLDANFDSTNGSVQRHSVSALTGGSVDLSGLTAIIAPDDIEDLLAFEASDGGILALGPLDSISGDGRVSVTVGPGGGTVAFGRGLDASSRVTFTSIGDTLVAVTGDSRFEHTDETAFNLESARYFVEGVNPLTIEVGGNDEGTVPTTSPNFGLAQLIVGSAAQPTQALLVDRVDNGNGHNLCSADREALYLYGFDAGPDAEGLRILNGSTLDLGGIDLYASMGGVLTHINPLLTPGVPFPFDEGFLTGGDPPDSDGDGIADSADNCVLAANPDQTDSDGDGYGNACDADLNGDIVVNAVDLGQLKAAFFSTPASANWNPNADFNNDGVINVVDLGIMRAAFFAPPGPSCAAPR